MYELFAWARPSVATARRAFGRLPRIATSAGRRSQEVREFCEAVGPLVASAGGSLEVAPGHAWVILPLAAVEEVGPLVEAAARRSMVHLFDPRTDWLLRPDGTSDGSPDWGFAATITGERRFGPGRPPPPPPGVRVELRRPGGDLGRATPQHGSPDRVDP